jgi:integrase
MCDGRGRALATRVTPGQAADTKQLVPLLDQVAKATIMHPHDRSRTTSTMEHRRSQAWTTRQLKIIQEQVGHRCDTSTAIYTHVSGDFMNTALRKALGPALNTSPGSGRKEL